MSLRDTAGVHRDTPDPLWRRPLRLPSVASRDLLAGVALLGLALVLFRHLLEGRVLYERDVHMNWHPQIEALVRCVVSGSWPVWNPYMGFGQPLLASHIQVLYPFTWLNLMLRPWTVYSLLVISHLVLAGCGLYALARRLGLSRSAAFLSGAVWIASGPLLSLANAWNHFAAAAFIPWALLAGDVALTSSSSLFLWAAALAAPILAGAPDVFLMVALLQVGHVVVFHLERPLARGANARRIGRTTLAFAGALGLSAGQWLPLVELALRSGRPALSAEVRNMLSLHPVMLPEIALPFRLEALNLQHEYLLRLLDLRQPLLHSIYLGVPALALLLGILVARPSRLSAALLVVLGAAVLVALGRQTVASEVFAWLVPPARMLRFPSKSMLVASFAWSLLVGLGYEAWRDPRTERRRWLTRVFPAVAVLLLLACLGVFLTRYGTGLWADRVLFVPNRSTIDALAPTTRRLAWSAAVSTVALSLVLLRWRRSSASRLLAGAAGILALVDLMAIHQDLNPTGLRDVFTNRPKALDYVDQGDHSRLYVEDYSVPTRTQREAGPSFANQYRLAAVPQGWSIGEAIVLAVHSYLNPPTAGRWGLYGSFDPDLQDLHPRPVAELVTLMRDTPDPNTRLLLLRRGGVSRVLTLGSPPWTAALEPVTTIRGLFVEPISVFRVPSPLPRSFAVAGGQVVSDRDALAALVDPQFDPKKEVLLASGPGRQAAPGFTGTSRVVTLTPDQVHLEAELSAPGYVVLLDSYDPGWQARVDGGVAEVLRANMAFRAVAVPAGRHRIELVYRPRAVTWGLLISAASLLLGLAIAWVPRS